SGGGQTPIPADFSGVSQNDLAIICAKHDRKQFIAALDSGILACLPGKNGYADTQPARNAVNRTTYRGSSQLLLKIFQKQNRFPTAEYCTFDQVQKAANHTGQRTHLIKGSKGITLNFQINGEQKSVRLFNIAQVNNPETIHTYADYLSQNRENYLREKYGDQYRPGEKPAGGPAVACSSSDPDVYLGQYMAAVSLERPFRASRQQAAEFAQKTKDFIFERNEAGHINPFNLNRLGSKASKYCKEMIPEITKPRGTANRQKPPPLAVAESSLGY
ncbi:MAG: ArdC family protein, partial [Treponema sp.]|nr:ArdC family protein [Treponema sp.]